MLKSKKIRIEKGRDSGKTFIVTEMPIIRADSLAMKIIHAVAGAGFDISSINPNLGVIALTQLTLDVIGRIPEHQFLEISNELLSCVKIVPNGGEARDIEVDIDIFDVATLMRLRKEAIAIHVDFLQQGESQDTREV